nr:YkvA family protein [Microvirga calopogonii]
MKPFTKAEMEAIRQETRDEEGLKRRFWQKLKRVAGKIPFAEDLVAAFYCATDPSTPRRVKLILVGAIAYFVFPADAISDFLPLLGFADDAAVLAAAITQVAGSITEEHREKAREALKDTSEQA